MSGADGLVLLASGWAAALAAAAWALWAARRATAAGERPRGAAAEAATPLERFRRGLARSRDAFAARLASLRGGEADAGSLRETLERALIESDIGLRTAERLLAAVDRLPRAERTPAAALRVLRREIGELLGPAPVEPEPAARPHVILVVGVNGVGKTTTIGKLAARHRGAGRSVLLVAGDTFRAAAIEQLVVWGERVGAPVVRQQPGSDPSAVVFDGMRAAVARGVDVVLVDTAGRLHTKVNLMEELRKVRRTVERVVEGAPHEVLLVLDATTGQNALAQARTFGEAVAVTGVVLTKLDGSARGGVAVAVAAELGLPIRYVGLGERIEDLEPFDPAAFVEGLLPPE